MLHQLKRLAKHSAIYGIGGFVSRILAVLLLPLYTHYLTRADYGRVETLTAASTVLVIVLRLGITSAFFRFYFDSKEPGRPRAGRPHVLLVHDGDGDRGPVAGLVLAEPIASALAMDGHADLVRAAAVGLWAQMNYEQLTSLFRVEQRSVQFVYASLANILVTVAATVVLVVGFDQHALGVLVGNFTGTLVVYLALLAYRRYQLGLEFDRKLLREMNKFGLPLVPSALALWAINFVDRLFVAHYKGQGEVGVYSVAVRDLVGDRVHPDRLQDGLARVRVLDRGRRRGAPDVRLRPDLPRADHLLGLARARRCSRPGSSTCSRRRRSTARRTPSRCSRSRPRPTPATRCSRSAAAARAGRSSTGS